MRKCFWCLICFLLIFTQDKVRENSLYISYGNGPNVGGTVGVGFETEIISDLTWSMTIGSLHPRIQEETNFSKIGYDFGFKYYFFHGIFTGLNYGYNSYEIKSRSFSVGNGKIITEENQIKTNGFTLSVGYKWKFIPHYYLNSFIGITNYSTKIETDFFSSLTGKQFDHRYGLMMGYQF